MFLTVLFSNLATKKKAQKMTSLIMAVLWGDVTGISFFLLVSFNL